MGTLYIYQCRKCGFEADRGSTQPYYVFSGSILQKYCPKTEQIVELFKMWDQGEPRLSCQDPDWQKELEDSTPCQNCKGACLKDLDIQTISDDWAIYTCPRCGNTKMDATGIIMAD